MWSLGRLFFFFKRQTRGKLRLHLHFLLSILTSADCLQPPPPPKKKLLMLRLFDASDLWKQNKLPIHAPRREFLCSLTLSLNTPFQTSPSPPSKKVGYHFFTEKKKKKNLHGHISLSPKECHLTSCIWDRISLSLSTPEKKERACWRVHVRDVLEFLVPPPLSLPRRSIFSNVPTGSRAHSRRGQANPNYTSPPPPSPPPLLPPSTANYDSMTINRSCYQIKEICMSGILFIIRFFVCILTFLAKPMDAT